MLPVFQAKFAPITIRLAKFEALSLYQYMVNIVAICENPDVKPGVIVLAEYSHVIQKKILTNVQKNPKKVYEYTIPMGIAKTLWLRWQCENIEPEIQLILGKVNFELNGKKIQSPIFIRTIM